jgi:hypothetical protein
VVQLNLGGCPLALSLNGSHERVPVLLLVPLLHGAVGGAFALPRG